MIRLVRRQFNRKVDFKNQLQVDKFMLDLSIMLDDIVGRMNGWDVFVSAAPTTGTWTIGDRAYNSAPASGQPIGWVCTVAGTPGTWKAFGTIS